MRLDVGSGSKANHSQVRAGDLPLPQPIEETGELRYGTAGESKETVSVKPLRNCLRHQPANDGE